MPGWLKQSTAASLVFGPFLSTSDGYTSKESFTALSGIMFKNSASTVITGVAASHTASGMYQVDLASGSTDTLGRLKFHIANSASHLPLWDDYIVIVANTYDSLVSGTDRLAASLGASGIAASTFGGSAINAAAIAASAIGQEAVSIAAARKIGDVTLRREWGEAASSTNGDTLTFRSLLGAAAKLVNKIAESGGTLTIYKADDTTSLGTQAVTTSSTASPITALDTN